MVLGVSFNVCISVLSSLYPSNKTSLRQWITQERLLAFTPTVQGKWGWGERIKCTIPARDGGVVIFGLNMGDGQSWVEIDDSAQVVQFKILYRL